MERLSEAYGKLLSGLALVACALLFFMTLMICGDVLLRNTSIIPGLRNIAWSNEVSEATLYLVTMLTAPWLLRQGRHIRVDVILRAVPKKLGWYCECASDFFAFACCLVMAVYGWSATAASWKAGSMSVKTLIMPEWWLLAPLPAAFLLLAIEMVFRMRRLYLGERAPRDDAVSAG
jgi:TRAP-type C4-dicarboxylate transport system permease small subunit